MRIMPIFIRETTAPAARKADVSTSNEPIFSRKSARATRKVKEVHVTTREDNNEAMKFYEKHGFNKAGILFKSSP
jgi:hypothetical protein